VPESAPLDPERLIRTLGRHDVAYVLIGALAARLQGFPRLTADADITPARDEENLARLAAALRELAARVYTESVPEGLPFDCRSATLARADLWHLVTSAGRLDVAFTPSGTGGFEDLQSSAIRFEVFGVEIFASDLRDIIRSKEGADRPQDRQDVLAARDPAPTGCRGVGRRDRMRISREGMAHGIPRCGPRIATSAASRASPPRTHSLGCL